MGVREEGISCLLFPREQIKNNTCCIIIIAFFHHYNDALVDEVKV